MDWPFNLVGKFLVGHSLGKPLMSRSKLNQLCHAIWQCLKVSSAWTQAMVVIAKRIGSPNRGGSVPVTVATAQVWARWILQCYHSRSHLAGLALGIFKCHSLFLVEALSREIPLLTPNSQDPLTGTWFSLCANCVLYRWAPAKRWNSTPCHILQCLESTQL